MGCGARMVVVTASGRDNSTGMEIGSGRARLYRQAGRDERGVVGSPPVPAGTVTVGGVKKHADPTNQNPPEPSTFQRQRMGVRSLARTHQSTNALLLGRSPTFNKPTMIKFSVLANSMRFEQLEFYFGP